MPEGETKRQTIPGFRMIDYIGHNKHGPATYVNQRINQQIAQQPVAGNEFEIGIRVGDLTISNVYRSPSSNFNSNSLPS